MVDKDPGRRAREFHMPVSRRAALGVLGPVLCATFLFLAGMLGSAAWTSLRAGDAVGFAVAAPALLFGILAAAMVAVVVNELPRAIRGDPVVEVGPVGIRLAHVGLIPWSGIRRAAIEQRAGGSFDDGQAGRVRFVRIAIWPRDPAVARRRPFGRAIGAIGDRLGWAPLGVFDYELVVPIEDLAEEIARYLPVDGWSTAATTSTRG